jgi:hypothetical protein
MRTGSRKAIGEVETERRFVQRIDFIHWLQSAFAEKSCSSSRNYNCALTAFQDLPLVFANYVCKSFFIFSVIRQDAFSGAADRALRLDVAFAATGANRQLSRVLPMASSNRLALPFLRLDAFADLLCAWSLEHSLALSRARPTFIRLFAAIEYSIAG